MQSLSPLKAPAARHYAWLTAAFAAFALYGSLVPFEFRPLPWAETQKRWAEVCAQPVRVESRSDWAANILLFVPLGFLGMAALCSDRGRAADWWAVPTAAAWACFSAFLEFSQLYFPPRDSSINDIAAESLGAAVGIAVWIAAGRPLTRRAREAWAGTETGGTALRLLSGYVVLLLVVQVFPPNLTISPVELYHRYKAGLVRPVPFAFWAVDPRAGAKKMVEGAAWFLPLGLLASRLPRWRSGGGRSALEVLALGTFTAASAEFLRLFVVTHSCDASDVATNGLAVVGGWFAGLDARKSAFQRLAAGAWVIGLVYLNWLPFDFRFDGASWARWREISWLPFVDYLQASYLEEAQGAADKVMQFLLLGALLALAFRPRLASGWSALLASACLLAVLFEAGQLFLPTRYTSVTDVLVETTSAGLGVIVWSRIQRWGVSPAALNSP
ncbi:MAG TPA: hypothetical protein DDY78_10005 [Planctomycetales bacterium]|jgi:VanZ family protein|nr:hypothetical protein [Planctomycetales bacterium]